MGLRGREVGAVGHRVGHLPPVHQPERDAVRRDPYRPEEDGAGHGCDDGDGHPQRGPLHAAQREAEHDQPGRDPADPAQLEVGREQLGERAERAQQHHVELAGADVVGQRLDLPDEKIGQPERGGGHP